MTQREQLLTSSHVPEDARQHARENDDCYRVGKGLKGSIRIAYVHEGHHFITDDTSWYYHGRKVQYLDGSRPYATLGHRWPSLKAALTALDLFYGRC